MKIKRNTEGLRIKLKSYKISIKELNTKKNSYQYTCILPPFLCSLFNITKDSAAPPNKFKELYHRILFYNYHDSLYLEDSNSLSEIRNIKEAADELKDTVTPEEITEEISRKINYKVFDNMDNLNFTTPYIVGNSNIFRITLPKEAFEDKIDVNQDNYIQYTIDTTEKNLLNNGGIIQVEILQE